MNHANLFSAKQVCRVLPEIEDVLTQRKHGWLTPNELVFVIETPYYGPTMYKVLTRFGIGYVEQHFLQEVQS